MMEDVVEGEVVEEITISFGDRKNISFHRGEIEFEIINGDYYFDLSNLVTVLTKYDKRIKTFVASRTKSHKLSGGREIEFIDEDLVLSEIIGNSSMNDRTDYIIHPHGEDGEEDCEDDHHIRILVNRGAYQMYNLGDVIRHIESIKLDPYYELKRKCKITERLREPDPMRYKKSPIDYEGGG